jgi:uncharacterized delta-60 repeat protein
MTYNGADFDFMATRVLADGRLDTSFAGVGYTTLSAVGPDDQGSAGRVLPDGSMIIVGGSGVSGTWSYGMVKLTPSGAVDLTFDGDSGTANGRIGTTVGVGANFATAVNVQRDGRILVGGYASNGTDNDYGIVRYLSDGKLDTSWGTGGIVQTNVGLTHDNIRGLLVQPDDRVLAVGLARTGAFNDFGFARYLPNGQLDTSFDQDGRLVVPIGPNHDDDVDAIMVDDGSIVTVGRGSLGGVYNYELMKFVGLGVTDYAPGRWGLGAATDLFGACLKSVGSGGATDGTTWSATGSCTAVDADPWHAIPQAASPAKIATSPLSNSSATAALRFGVRPSLAQPPGSYVAPIALEVLAPTA